MTHSRLPLIIGLIVTFGTAARADDTEQGTLEAVDRVRGGRHWIDAPTDPPRSPEESRKAFVLEPGLSIELFAAEPLVMDPVAIAFDERGRAFVVEYGDYPVGPEEEGAKPLSRVVLLDDTDGDHRADKRTVFAEHLDFAHSLLPYDGGLIVGARTQLLFLKDTDGDDRADVRRVLFEGFTPAHPQMQIGNPRYGFDNLVYCNYGPGKITVPESGGQPLDMPRNEFWFDPRTGDHGPAAGLGQFGNTIDDWGERFFCTNRNPIMTAVIPWEAARRNPFATVATMHTDVAPSGGASKVYPVTETKSNYLSHAGTHTSACGVTAFRGDMLGPDHVNNVFVCEPIGHLVTRSIVTTKGRELVAKRGREKADFLASKDTWFRPASLATGPEGALYLADMYRLWVEHPKFLPEDVAAKIDWRAGDDRGRIWRIVRPGLQERPFTTPTTSADRAALLGDANGWRRSLGQRLIVERNDVDAAPALRALLAARDNDPRTRLHAVWTLRGLGQFNEHRLRVALTDPHPLIRRAGILAAPPRPEPHLLGQIRDVDPRVRFAVALRVGEVDPDEAIPGSLGTTLVRGLTSDVEDPWFRTAVMTSCRELAADVIVGLVVNHWNEPLSTDRKAALIAMLRQLASVIGARGDVQELQRVLKLVDGDRGSGHRHELERRHDWWRTAIVAGLAEGQPRHTGELGRKSLGKLLDDPPERLADSVEPVKALLANAATVAVDPKRSSGDRVAAIQLLAFRSFDSVAKEYGELLGPSQPVDVQLASLAAMRNGGARAAELVLDRWPTLGPAVRGDALGLLLLRSDSTAATLRAMIDERIPSSVVDLDRRVRLLRHGEAEIRSLAAKVFGGAVSANRREVAEQYAPAITRTGSRVAGAKVFEKTCAKCHKVNGVGHVVGPDISDVRNRAREALLYDILDPNRVVEPRFTDYAVVTADGRLFNGLLVAETDDTIVLRRPEGKEETINRADIDLVKSTGKSLMPEGVEKEITVEQMADLLEFLTGR